MKYAWIEEQSHLAQLRPPPVSYASCTNSVSSRP
jgi:hypothetical protein